jgi:hypothetical protein
LQSQVEEVVVAKTEKPEPAGSDQSDPEIGVPAFRCERHATVVSGYRALIKGPNGMRGVKVKNQPHLRIPKSHWNPDMSLSDVKAFRATKSKVRVMDAEDAFRHRIISIQIQ